MGEEIEMASSPAMKISSGLRSFDRNHSLLVTLEAKSFQKIHSLLIREITKKDKKGIYVSFTKSHREVESLLTNLNVNMEKIMVVDAIGKSSEKVPGKGNCYCLASPESLTELSIILSQLMKGSKYDYLLFDTLSAFLIYHDLETTERFVHYLMEKTTYFGMKGIFISLNDTKSKELTQMVSHLFDAHLDLTK